MNTKITKLIKLPKFLQFILPALVLILITAATGTAQTNNRSQTLSSALNADGTLKQNIAGSFNPKGFRLTTDSDGKPHFVAEQKNKENLTPQTEGCPDNWDSRFFKQGLSNTAAAIAVDTNGDVYIGGTFTAIGNIFANGIAKWDGVKWSALGNGVTGTTNPNVNIGVVSDIEIVGGIVYVAGNFTKAGDIPANHIAKWTGGGWSALGGGVNGLGISDMTFGGGDLYVGGTFSFANYNVPGTGGNVRVNNIARWNFNTGTWSALKNATNGVIGTNNTVNGLAFGNGILYAGGFFVTAGGIDVRYVAQYNGSIWSGMGGGVSGVTPANGIAVNTLDVSGSDVYIGGNFKSAGGIPANYIAKWNGTNWAPLSYGVNNIVYSIKASDNGDVFVGGLFLYAGNSAEAFGIARWRNGEWSGLADGVNPGNGSNYSVSEIAVRGNDLYIGGNFTKAGGVFANNAAHWNGSGWSAIDSDYGQGANGGIKAIVSAGDGSIYVGGDFTRVGGVSANHIAKWDGTQWTALGTGTNNIIYAIAVDSNNNVYVGGLFSMAGGVTAQNVAKWNGTSWSALANNGISGQISALAFVGDDLYAGGSFNYAAGYVFYIAKWNGTSWQRLNSNTSTPLNGFVTSLAAYGSDLYVTGSFTTANGLTVNRVTKWDGTNWSALGSGVNSGAVNVVTVSNKGDVYIGGSFTAVGGTAAKYIAEWNGGSWSSLGGEMNFVVYSIKADGEDLYVGGKSDVSGTNTGKVFRWNSGSGWSDLEGDILTAPIALFVDSNSLYVGGGIVSAGCRVSNNFARYFLERWTNGAGTNDWHDGANWSNNNIPPDNASLSIAASDISINTADVQLRDLRIENNRTLTIGAGRTLTIAGNLNLNGGYIDGAGSVVVTNCTPAAISGVLGDGSAGYIRASLVRCVNNTGSFTFPVGTENGYTPVTLSNITGSGNFSVTPKQGAYAGAASGLPLNRLARWWNLTNLGITKTDVTFNYLPGDITAGTESNYRVFKVENGGASFEGGTLDPAARAIVVADINQFSDWTLAEPLSPTAANVSVAGRVLTKQGSSIAKAQLVLTDSNGNQRVVTSNTFGYFKFNEVPSGETYILSVRSKRFDFVDSPRVINVFEDLADINFVGSSIED